MTPKVRAFLTDAAERVGSTAAQAFLATFGVRGLLAVAGGDWNTVTTLARAGEVAALAAALAAVKALLAASKKNTVSPASLAPAQQPGQAEQDAPPPVAADTVARATLAVPVTTVVLPERKISGRRLGRHVHHDERSRAYAITPVPAASLRSVRHTRHVKPYDQGDVGSCTGNACAGALSTSPFTHRFTESRAVKLYEAATVLDDVPGTYPPDDTGSSGLAVAKAAQQAGYITSYRHAFSADAVYAALQTGPVIVGVSWLTGFDTPTADGQMVYNGPSRGGHELCMDEIDVERQRVWVTNSWGPSWGLAGRAWWSFDDFARVLADSGDATQLIR